MVNKSSHQNVKQPVGISDFQTIGFWPRLLAALIDGLLTMAIFLPPMYVLYGPLIFGTDPNHRPGTLYTVLSIVVPAVIVIVFWLKIASTPGKLFIDSEIVDADTGDVPTMKQWALRYLGYYVATVPLGYGLLCVLWDKKHQGWHDKMAGTLVVRKSGGRR